MRAQDVQAIPIQLGASYRRLSVKTIAAGDVVCHKDGAIGKLTYCWIPVIERCVNKNRPRPCLAAVLRTNPVEPTFDVDVRSASAHCGHKIAVVEPDHYGEVAASGHGIDSLRRQLPS